ncbi:zona pellucida sperm-binding protein 3-like [Solea solea]|uniref:zona pellucida sperm-binding protein 3-like n=1 Tax=Solea solea TaxID=90069 RepID=UPI00272A93EE|nr:zona pellucida sperm-binding protein 3-like [Solea solea]
MAMKCTAVCLMALSLLGSFCDAQWSGYKPSKPYQKPAVPTRQEPIKKIAPPQQSKQDYEKPLTWVYPQVVQPEPQPAVPFELRYPVPAATVAVQCRESIVHVEVKKDMFGIGQFINTADLTLGSCTAVAEDNAAQVLIFQSELHECGGSLTVTGDSLIYTYTMNYNPQHIGDSPVVRTSQAAVFVECHYPRNHNVSSLPLDPLWIPFSAVKVAEEFLSFTLTLMTDDWQYERPSYQYFLGDIINIEATVKQFFHAPLRVYVDHCVATLSPDVSSNPKYAFIENNGCLVDARLTGSASRFMGRSSDAKLQFQLEAFRFQGVDSGMVYITCQLRATLAAYPLDSLHRACSYNNGWKEASSVDTVCGSCESPSFGPVGGTSAAIASGASTIFAGGFGPGSSTGSGIGGGIGGGSGTGGGGGGAQPVIPARKIRDVSTTEAFEWVGDIALGVYIGERAA